MGSTPFIETDSRVRNSSSSASKAKVSVVLFRTGVIGTGASRITEAAWMEEGVVGVLGVLGVLLRDVNLLLLLGRMPWG
jgi:hypothetical protein